MTAERIEPFAARAFLTQFLTTGAMKQNYSRVCMSLRSTPIRIACFCALPVLLAATPHKASHAVRRNVAAAGSSDAQTIGILVVVAIGLGILWLLLRARRSSSAIIPAGTSTETSPPPPQPDPYQVAKFETLTAIDTPFVLGRDERCYASHEVEESILTDHVQYRGGYSGMSFRVARGVYMRTGGTRGNRVVTQSLDHVDNGTLYITTQRLVFNGRHSAQEIKRTKVAGMDRYNDGVVIKRTSGKPVFYGSPDVASLTAHLERFVSGTLDKEHGGVSMPQASHAEPVNVDVTVSMNGAHGTIVAYANHFAELLLQEVNARDPRRKGIIAIPAREAVTADTATVQSYVHTMSAYLIDASKMAVNMAQTEAADSNDEYVRKLTLRYAVALETLLDAQEKLRKTDHPKGFDDTQQSITRFLDEAYTAFCTWPKQLTDAVAAFTDGGQFEAHLRTMLDANSCIEALAREEAAWLHETMGV